MLREFAFRNISSVLIAAGLLILSEPAVSGTPVALELVLAADASSSVDDKEYALQVSGYVKAFRDPDVVAAIEALGPSGIAVTFVEWSDRWQQVQSVDWTHVIGAASARRFAGAIAAQAKLLEGTGTAIGTAISYAVELFDGNGDDGARRIIDVSSDDRFNSGSHLSVGRDFAVSRNITVNALAVDGDGALTRYFRKNVIGGAGAFVIAANSFEGICSRPEAEVAARTGYQSAHCRDAVSQPGRNHTVTVRCRADAATMIHNRP